MPLVTDHQHPAILTRLKWILQLYEIIVTLSKRKQFLSEKPYSFLNWLQLFCKGCYWIKKKIRFDLRATNLSLVKLIPVEIAAPTRLTQSTQHLVFCHRKDHICLPKMYTILRKLPLLPSSSCHATMNIASSLLL